MSMLLDSNILIYASKANSLDNPAVIATQQKAAALSDISRIEVLGYHGLKGNEKLDLEQMTKHMEILPVTRPITDLAIELRQQKSMSLGDAIIAATALEYELPLLTRNTGDFKWIDGLVLVNPFA